MQTLYIIAGANGSGKTTFAKSFSSLNNLYFINADEIAKELNFDISLIYLFLENPDINILRVKNRVLNGGHYVPTKDIIRRFYRSKNMFQNTYKDMVDTWSIYYNSNEIFEEIADNSQVFDNEKYNEFLKDTDANNNR
jgi:predicted ABC-type ATPase